jgi:hypothetical protein
MGNTVFMMVEKYRFVKKDRRTDNSDLRCQAIEEEGYRPVMISPIC